MNILALDFDDCIIEWNLQTELSPKDLLQQLELNLKKLDHFRTMIHAKYFITSSWSKILDYDNGNISIKEKCKSIISNDLDFKIISLIQSYLNGNICGICPQNRFVCIQNLLDEGNIVVAFDDINLDSIQHPKFKYVPTFGVVSSIALMHLKSWIYRHA